MYGPMRTKLNKGMELIFTVLLQMSFMDDSEVLRHRTQSSAKAVVTPTQPDRNCRQAYHT